MVRSYLQLLMSEHWSQWESCSREEGVSIMADLELGQKIQFKSHRALMAMALNLSAEGYGVAILGYHDIYSHVLTITALPEEGE